ncbi:MAG TPA: hypothetical protein VG759_02390, partial [Candidatus Angelobacter sp.]|nr:hypothetical protein [Candidatus Angelobacter sp.]
LSRRSLPPTTWATKENEASRHRWLWLHRRACPKTVASNENGHIHLHGKKVRRWRAELIER